MASRTRAKRKKAPPRGERKVPRKPSRRIQTVRKGDIILMDYTGTVKETDEIFDTTMEDEARKAGIFDEKATYKPKLVAVGEGWVLRGLDKKLVGLEVLKKHRVELKPAEAFGERDPTKIEIVPYRSLRAEKIVPRPGLSIRYKGREATIRSVSGGRVSLDYNPPLAGRTLVYELTIKRIVKGDEEKVTELAHRWLPTIEADKFMVEFEGKTLRIALPKDAFYLEGIQVVKRGIFKDIEKLFPEIDRVDFVESYIRGAS
ncbi:MAG: FKBP-type peptidyl-prolyl cis-trans isomerase [Candidatus Bathyarchaeia archaeon]